MASFSNRGSNRCGGRCWLWASFQATASAKGPSLFCLMNAMACFGQKVAVGPSVPAANTVDIEVRVGEQPLIAEAHPVVDAWERLVRVVDMLLADDRPCGQPASWATLRKLGREPLRPRAHRWCGSPSYGRTDRSGMPCAMERREASRRTPVGTSPRRGPAGRGAASSAMGVGSRRPACRNAGRLRAETRCLAAEPRLGRAGRCHRVPTGCQPVRARAQRAAPNCRFSVFVIGFMVTSSHCLIATGPAGPAEIAKSPQFTPSLRSEQSPRRGRRHDEPLVGESAIGSATLPQPLLLHAVDLDDDAVLDHHSCVNTATLFGLLLGCQDESIISQSK